MKLTRLRATLAFMLALIAVPATGYAQTSASAPAIDSAEARGFPWGANMHVHFTAELDPTSVPAASAFSVAINGEPQAIPSEVSIDWENSGHLSVGLTTRVAYGDKVTLSYAQPIENPIKDMAGNLAESFTREMENTTPLPISPTLLGATVETQDWGEGSGPFGTVTLTYDQPFPCHYGLVPPPNGADFTVKVDGITRSVMAGDDTWELYCQNGWQSNGRQSGTIVMQLSSPAAAGEEVTVSYTPGTNLIWGYGGGSAAALTDHPVENLVGKERVLVYAYEGEPISTDPEENGATASDPVETSITVPESNIVSIFETGTNVAEPTGFSLLSQQVDIEAPTAPAGSYYEVTFTLDSSLLLSQDPPATASSIVIFKTDDGVTQEVPNCTDIAPGTYPCVSSRQDVSGDAQITVRTQDFSSWNFGTRSVSSELKGFYSPVDMNNTLNTVKAGATVPMKFEVLEGKTEITDASIISISSRPVTCPDGSLTDAIELTTSGSTSLRYDETTGQFVYNWKTPKNAGCHAVKATTVDGSSMQAFFKLK